jgi:delta 1-pyrroline-5-carboxylate dehydrogenase
MIRFAQKALLGPQIYKFSAVDRVQLVRMMHSLVKYQAYVNGKWTDASDNKRFNVLNPANQKVVGEVPDMTVVDVQKAIDSAYDAFHSKAWKDTTAKERSSLLKVKRHCGKFTKKSIKVQTSRIGFNCSKATNKKSPKS